MTDERYENGVQPGVYDDDRLLACALGLDEDPELLAAAAADAGLAARLEATRADVAAIGAQVSAAVPAPDESYTDLSGARWSGLREYVEAQAAAAPRRGRRWWRVVAPVAAVLVVALVVGIVAVQDSGMMSASSDGAAEVARSADEATGAESSGQTLTESSTPPTPVAPTVVERFADQLDRFAVVVLARAREVSGAVQKFAVLRIFKGQAPGVVELVVDDDPADSGRLHLLMLDPTAPPETVEGASGSPWPLAASPLPVTESPWPGGESPWPAGSSPEPIPTLVAADGPGVPLAVSYTYHGEPAMVREFAAGTDPDTISLRIP